MSNKLNKLISKRFVIRKSLIGTNTVITFTTKKGKEVTYTVSKSTKVTLTQITYQHSVDNTECLHRVRKHSCIARCIAKTLATYTILIQTPSDNINKKR